MFDGAGAGGAGSGPEAGGDKQARAERAAAAAHVAALLKWVDASLMRVAVLPSQG